MNLNECSVEGLRKSHSDIGMISSGYHDDEEMLTCVLKVNRLTRKSSQDIPTPPVTPEFVRQGLLLLNFIHLSIF